MASKNSGKVFEEDVSKSIDRDKFFVHRLKDSAQAYKRSKGVSFCWDNPCDLFVFNPLTKTLFAIEEKTTKYKSFTFDDPDGDDKESKMVKRHQILSLTDFSRYRGVYPMFLFNFRDIGDDKIQMTYAQHIDDFRKMLDNIGNKKSFNILDVVKNGGIKIDGIKKRTRYTWDMDRFFNSRV